ncbi:hypothetical protein [Streptomyces canus]|uniref:hypothetical protein n=1 Tax=Streptomyces canus TaxID=58343 RepID=UPI00324B6E63
MAEAAAAAAPTAARVAGGAVLLIPHRGGPGDEAALPADYRKILATARAADGPVQVRAVGEELGLEVAVRGKLERLRAKMTKLADRGWLHCVLTAGPPHAPRRREAGADARPLLHIVASDFGSSAATSYGSAGACRGRRPRNRAQVGRVGRRVRSPEVTHAR